MELEFGKHFKDATNLLLMMDHDSGYVEGGESCTSSSNESYSVGGASKVSRKPTDCFLLSEDALLEKPDICVTLREYSDAIESEDYEETRRLFFSPEFLDSSVKSENSTIIYSGLENESSRESPELPLQKQIEVKGNMEGSNLDISTASASDMSLETSTYDPLIIENTNVHEASNDTISPFKGFPIENKLEKVLNESGSFTDMDCNLSKQQSTSSVNVSARNISESEIHTNLASPYKSQPLTFVTNTFEVPKEKKRLTLVFSKSDKENSYSVKRKYPSLTPDKNYENPKDSGISPEIFDDEMIDNQKSYFEVNKESTSVSLVSCTKNIDIMEENKLDKKLLKRIHSRLSGVLPPPSVTIVHLSVHDILAKLDENKKYFWNVEDHDDKENTNDNKVATNTSLNSSGSSNTGSKSLLVNTTLEMAKNAKWPEETQLRYHGLHHNCGKISEEIADLCDKYQKRFVGAETQSTCTVFETQNTSPSKKRMIRPKWGGAKSPGRRLSHLARRRITFSNANLQAGGSSLVGSRARQILVDARKMELLNRRKSPRKTPKKTPKKTPSKSPLTKTRTPSSSAKKKLAMRFRKLTGEFEKSLPGALDTSSVSQILSKSPDKHARSENCKGSSKRALFQSPNRDMNSSLYSNKSFDAPSGEKVQLRRALFISPKKSSPLKGKKSPFKQTLRFGIERKRKRSETDENPPSKFARSMSMDVSGSSRESNKSLTRAQSELNISLNRSVGQQELSELHKKKLQWAVYAALQSQNITNAHPQWKVFASVLARVTRRFFTSQVAASVSAKAKLDGGTTERMHRIARHHVISVIKGKTADEIIADHLRSRARVQKPQGYIAPEEYQQLKNKVSSSCKDGVFQDRGNTIESWEKQKKEQISKLTPDSKVERIRKVINFGDDR